MALVKSARVVVYGFGISQVPASWDEVFEGMVVMGVLFLVFGNWKLLELLELWMIKRIRTKPCFFFPFLNV
jgi:hypothetical protein